MQTITTITTETKNIIGADFQITIFEQMTSAICDICGESESGTIEQLKRSGWQLCKGSEFCPNCN